MLIAFKEITELTRDFFFTAHPKDILLGERLFRPFQAYQQAWMSFHYPGEKISTKKSTWSYLQTHQMPFIQKYASSYHLQGIELLGLNQAETPTFNELKQRFAAVADGFTLVETDKELSPQEYFVLISEKKFPCIASMRPHEELFCGNSPDFWHDALGHVTALCCKPVQEFYLKAAARVLEAQNEQEFNRRLAIYWTLIEYGFLQEEKSLTMFGAALVGSHLACMRYHHNLIAVEPVDIDSILNLRFYDGETSALRNQLGQFRFFALSDLSGNELEPLVTAPH